jgi:hypothetical protein
MSTRLRAVRLALVCAAPLVAAACGSPEVRVLKSVVDEGKITGVTARVDGAADGTAVTFKISDGQQCGTLSAASASTAAGMATVTFTGATGVEDCKATIEAAAQGNTNRASLFVNKLPLTKARIDGVSLLALFVIASFAVDRIVQATLFSLSFFAFWRRLVPEAASGPAAKRARLAYVLMASVVAVIILGWFGKVRMLSALGFAQVNPVLDTLFTGLLVVGGAERTESLLDRLGAGAGGDKAAAAAKPIEITGRLVLEDSQKNQPPSSMPGGFSVGV